MKVVSKVAMAMALTLGGTALVATPAAAQKKENGKDNGGLKVSNEFRKPAEAARTAIEAKDWATADAQLTAMDAIAKTDDEKYYAAYLRSRVDAQRNNVAGLMKDLQVLIASPRTPPADLPVYQRQYYALAGDAALKDKKYAEGIDLLLKSRAAGNTDFDLSLSLANAYSATGKQAESVAEVDRAIQAVKASGQKPPVAWYQFAIPKVYALGDRAAIAQWVGKMLQDYPTTKNWHWAILVIRGSGDTGGAKLTNAQRVDLYRLMRATKVLADANDYYEYASSVNQLGMPRETVAVIGEGRAAGKIPAGDADFNHLYTAAEANAKADASLAVIAKQGESAATGKAAAASADALFAGGEFAKAEALYAAALQKGGVDADTINLHRGVALYNLGRKDDARTAFAQVKGAPARDIALLWTVALDLPPLTAA